MFIYFLEREREHEQGRGRERRRQNLKQAPSELRAVNTEPDLGLKVMVREIMT